MKLCSMYSYYRGNVCAKNEQSRWKIVLVRNFTHCPPLSQLLQRFSNYGQRTTCGRWDLLLWSLNSSCYCWVLRLLLNILGHQSRFRHRAWKGRQILLRGSNFGLRFFLRAVNVRHGDPRLYFPFEGSHTQNFYALKKFIDLGQDRTREPRILRWVW